MYQYQQFAILLRGGGDIATGIALRLYRSGFRRLIILETAHPMAVRRRVAFSEAVYEGLCTVEGITAALAPRPEEIAPLWDAGCIPVMVDPQGVSIPRLRPEVIIEATLAKRNVASASPMRLSSSAWGPASPWAKNVHCIVETNRGHNLGRVLYAGSAEPDTGIPGDIVGMTTERVLRAPQTGIFLSRHDIGDHVKAGDIVATVEPTAYPRKSALLSAALSVAFCARERPLRIGSKSRRGSARQHGLPPRLGQGLCHRRRHTGSHPRTLQPPLLHPQGHPPLPCGQERAHSVNNATSEPFHTRRTGEAACNRTIQTTAGCRSQSDGAGPVYRRYGPAGYAARRLCAQHHRPRYGPFHRCL